MPSAHFCCESFFLALWFLHCRFLLKLSKPRETQGQAEEEQEEEEEEEDYVSLL